jgi:hypothetical protein
MIARSAFCIADRAGKTGFMAVEGLGGPAGIWPRCTIVRTEEVFERSRDGRSALGRRLKDGPKPQRTRVRETPIHVSSASIFLGASIHELKVSKESAFRRSFSCRRTARKHMRSGDKG